MERATKGLKFQIGDVVLPVLVDLADEFNEVISDAGNAKLAVDTFKIALDGVVSIGGSIVSTGQSIRSAIGGIGIEADDSAERSEEHTSELQSLMRNSYAVFCLTKNKQPPPYLYEHVSYHLTITPSKQQIA